MQTNQTIELTTLSQLLHNEEFNRKVIPFLKSEYFNEKSEKVLFEEINDFVDKYKNPPTKTSLEIEIEKRKDLSETEHKKVLDLLNNLEDNKVDYDWLVDTVEKRIEFDLEKLNQITKGGLPQKTLNIALAGTGVGKSLFMCHLASSTLMQGKNVLYITLEMAEEKIAERIDANLMNITIDDLHTLPKKMFEDKIRSISKKTVGKLVIKEYPTASAHSGHFRSLVKELAIKKSFKPDLICIDYLNICASSRFKGNASVGSYFYIKAIAEELRGFAVESSVPIVSATQTTRSAYTSTDVGLEDTSESFGLPATADLMFALISTEELEDLNQIMIKQLKNRYNDPTINKRFIVGIDRAKMKLYDVEQVAQGDIVDSGQDETIFDKSNFGKRLEKKTYEKFSDLKI